MNSTVSRTALQLHEKITGRKILARLEELNHTQWLSRDELLKLQQEKLLHLVEYAYQYVPFYRHAFQKIGFLPQDLSKDPACFSQLPILTKAIIRENNQDLLTTEPKRCQQMSRLSTSGSTGEPLVFLQDTDYRDYVTADIQRHMGWAGWKLGDPQAVIWGASLNRKTPQKVRAQLIDWVWNRIQLNTYLMNKVTMAAFANKIRQNRPKVLLGYATVLNQFADFVRQSPFTGITFQGVFSTAEVLVPSVRQFIEETFQCKVFNRYGTLELGGIACECSAHTGLHISVENNYVEILNDGLPSLPGVVGDLIVTNLNNHGMPFIRYSIGDASAWYESGNCPCGRSSMMIKNIEGRITEMFQTRDGRMVRAAFSGGFRCLAHPSIKQFQVVQKTVDRMVIRLVQNGEIPQITLNDITHSVQTNYGENVTVDFEFMDAIPSLPSGKHQYAVSELTKPGAQ